MKAISILALTAVALTCLILTLTAIGSQRKVSQLRQANQALQTELQSARGSVATLTTEKQESARQLAVIMTRHGELVSRIAELEADDVEETAMATSSAALRPYQAEAFLGRRALGLVWIVPRNLRLDTNSQRYVYEPVVCLDEKFRRFFEVHHTNIVEQLVETPVYVNNNYYEDPYYYSGRYWPRQTNNWPTQPGPVPQPNPPPFNPGNGTIIKQPLGTPAERIKTYPTAPKLPANPAPKSPASPPPTLPQANQFRAAGL